MFSAEDREAIRKVAFSGVADGTGSMDDLLMSEGAGVALEKVAKRNLTKPKSMYAVSVRELEEDAAGYRNGNVKAKP